MTSQTSELVERARASLLHIECFYEAKDAKRRIKDIIDALNALERLSSSEVTEEEVELVARAIYESRPAIQFYARGPGDPPGNRQIAWDEDCAEHIRATARDQARAAITAMRSAVTSERKG